LEIITFYKQNLLLFDGRRVLGGHSDVHTICGDEQVHSIASSSYPKIQIRFKSTSSNNSAKNEVFAFRLRYKFSHGMCMIIKNLFHFYNNS